MLVGDVAGLWLGAVIRQLLDGDVPCLERLGDHVNVGLL